MGNRGVRAAKAGLAYTIGNILVKGITFLTLPIFTRMLTTEQFGVYNLYVSYETLLTIFTGMCIYGSLRTAKYDYATRFGEYTTNALTLSLVVLSALLILGNVTYPVYAAKLDFDRLLLNTLIIHSYAMFVFQFYNTKIALEYDYKKFLIISAINSIGGTVLSIALIFFVSSEDRAYGRIYGYAIVPILIASSLVYNYLQIAFRNKHRFIDLSIWKYGLRISLPLVVHTFSQQILHQFDRIMIDNMSGKSSVGIYGFVQTIANILQIIVLSMDNAWSVWMYEQLSEKNYKEIYRKAKLYILLMNVLYVGFISLAPDIIRLLGTKDYFQGRVMIVPLAFAVYFVFLYSLPVHVEYFNKKTNYIAMGTSLAAVSNIILNYIFIKFYGYEAAAWTTLASYIVLFVFHLIIAKKIDSNKMFPLRTTVWSITVLGLFSLTIIFFVDKWLVRWVLMVSVIVAGYFINKSRINEALSNFSYLRKLRGHK